MLITFYFSIFFASQCFHLELLAAKLFILLIAF